MFLFLSPHCLHNHTSFAPSQVPWKDLAKWNDLAAKFKLCTSPVLKSKESECLEAIAELQEKIQVYRDYLACLSLLEPAAATEKMLNSCGGYSEQAKKLQADFRTKYKTLTAMLN